MPRNYSIPGSIIPKRDRAFNLFILLLIAIALLLIAVFSVPQYSSGREPQAHATAVSLYNIKQALTAFNRDCGRYPTTAEGLDALVHPPKGLAGWRQYMDKLPKDGWGNPFIYILPAPGESDFDLYSIGEDGEGGTNDDIHLRDLN